MEFGVLGPLEVRDGERLIAFGSSQQRALLAALLLEANRPVSVDRLMETLWGDQPPRSAAAVVKNRVSQLRKLLAPVELRTEPSGYLLRVEPEQLDIDRFEQLAGDGRAAITAGRWSRAAALLTEALALWRGPALADFAYDAFAQAAIARLEELRLAALEDRAEALLACGRATELVSELDALVEEHPLRERLRGQLMLALYRSGRQAEALETYRRARETLVEQLGIDPSARLQALYKQILNQDEVLTPAASAAKVPIKLPSPPNRFIGRRRDVDAISALVLREDVRLITLSGPGGTGKTRLAIEAAVAAAEAFPDGVFWVGLAPLRDPALVMPTVAQALEAQGNIAEHIGSKQLLLVLDNFEQVVEAAVLVAALLTACPLLTLLVTSRQPLHLSSEHAYPVAPLVETDAAALFQERTRATGVEVALNAEVIEICRRLDGLPLAIELAAARAKTLPPPALLHRLERRLPVLTGGPRDLPERQQTLRSTIAWSYDLLTSEEQRLLAALSVFAGGCTLEAAEQICDADIDTLHSLIDKNLLRRSDERYWMLETIREYAAEQLSDLDPDAGTQRRHARFFSELAERAGEGWRSVDEPLWRDRLGTDQNNIRAALVWLESTGEADDILALVCGMTGFWTMRGDWLEGLRWLEPALARTSDQRSRARAKALSAASTFLLWLGQLERARTYGEHALAILRELGNPKSVGRGLANLGVVATALGDTAEARRLGEEALVHSRAAKDLPNLASVTNNLGYVAMREGDDARAMPLLQKSLVLYRELGLEEGAAQCLFNLAFSLFRTGVDAEALATARQSLTLSHRIGDVRSTINNLVLIGALAARQEWHLASARLLGAAEAERLRTGLAYDELETSLHENTLLELRCALEDHGLEAALAQGRLLSLEEAVARACRAPAKSASA